MKNNAKNNPREGTTVADKLTSSGRLVVVTRITVSS